MSGYFHEHRGTIGVSLFILVAAVGLVLYVSGLPIDAELLGGGVFVGLLVAAGIAGDDW